MINLNFAKNKTYYVVGLGKSNRAVIKALQKVEADIRVWDDNADNLSAYDQKVICPLDKAPWSKIKAVIVSPGIAPTHEIVKTAKDKDIPVICDIDLYCQSEPKSQIISITGTNGKSTVTALINHILGDNSQMGGNIGMPVMNLKNRAHYTVLELSSYQLDYSPNLKSDVAILLNITPDHLDWHGDMDHYVTAKSKIFNHAETKIISIDDAYSKSIFEKYSDAQPLSIYGDELPFTPSHFTRLKGDHNIQNMLAAYMACQSLGIKHDIIIERMKSFEGLEHRQYLVRVINGIPYINDSKATNAEATKMALNAYKNILWIAGGLAKDGGLKNLAQNLETVQKAYLYGDAREEFAKFLNNHGIEIMLFETLEQATEQAHKDAQSMRGEPSGTPTVLLSPACASFDQYPNFEVRGNHFVDLVNDLDEE